MITPKEINEKFFRELKAKEKAYGRGFNKFLCGETKLSSGYISSIVTGKQTASQDAQIRISAACGIDYQSLVSERNELKPKTKNTQKYTVEIEDQETWQHLKVIKRFKNKGIALAMNEKLADFEEYDQWKFMKLLNHIDEYIEGQKKQDVLLNDQPKNGSTGK